MPSKNQQPTTMDVKVVCCSKPELEEVQSKLIQSREEGDQLCERNTSYVAEITNLSAEVDRLKTKAHTAETKISSGQATASELEETKAQLAAI